MSTVDPDILDEILEETVEDELMPQEDLKITKKQVEVSKIIEEKLEYLPGCGVDIGTSNIVIARRTKDGTFVNRFHRNMLYPLDVTDEAADLLEKSSYLYVKVGNKYFVVGEDALTLVNAIGEGEVVRPMKDGILNPSLKESTELLFYIIKAVVGDPIIKNEPLRFSLPANPVDSDMNNKFHEMILQNFFDRMGYNAKPVNEAMCIAYDCNPILKGDKDVSLSGITVSSGGGMTNVALCYKGLPLQEFSITKSGDYVDEQAANVSGVKKSKIVKLKENQLDLLKVDFSDRILSALGVYYDEMMERVIYNISKKFSNTKSDLDGQIEIVIAGGSSMPNGFCQKFEEKIRKNTDFPFDVYRVRHSKTPFYSVSQGACIRSQADYAKNK